MFRVELERGSREQRVGSVVWLVYQHHETGLETKAVLAVEPSPVEALVEAAVVMADLHGQILKMGLREVGEDV